MQVIKIHFERVVTETLKTFCEKIVKDYPKKLSTVPESLTDIESRYGEIQEQLKSNNKDLVYSKVDNLKVDIKAKSKDVFSDSPNVYTSSHIKATLISEPYICLAIFENTFVCIKNPGDEILFIDKKLYHKVICDSL